MNNLLIKDVNYINEGDSLYGDILIRSGRIEKIAPHINRPDAVEIAGEHLVCIPGVIDDQVHFRQPGLTHKADIASESRAAIAGGTTSFMEMPNTKPAILTQDLLQKKYELGRVNSWANYSFYMGASNDNMEEVLKTNPGEVCGVKIFMGSSTGNMLVDDRKTLENLFSEVPMLIATHCEDEQTIRANLQYYESKYGMDLTASYHPKIRSVEGCLLSTSLAIELAKKYDTRLHVLHISTGDELALFSNSIPLSQKRITSEVCVHHLHFDASDYGTLGNLIKCNPAIKEKRHRILLFEALLDNRLDVVATDHAPHTFAEKSQHYLQAPSGLPLVQHSLYLMLDFFHHGKITLERIVEKMSHAPATCFEISKRGFIREGYWADLVLLDLSREYEIHKDNIHYRCDWSPLEGKRFQGCVEKTLVNGHVVYDRQEGFSSPNSQRLLFERA